jgi:hypothetical protein
MYVNENESVYGAMFNEHCVWVWNILGFFLNLHAKVVSLMAVTRLEVHLMKRILNLFKYLKNINISSLFCMDLPQKTNNIFKEAETKPGVKKRFCFGFGFQKQISLRFVYTIF